MLIQSVSFQKWKKKKKEIPFHFSTFPPLSSRRCEGERTKSRTKWRKSTVNNLYFYDSYRVASLLLLFLANKAISSEIVYNSLVSVSLARLVEEKARLRTPSRTKSVSQHQKTDISSCFTIGKFIFLFCSFLWRLGTEEQKKLFAHTVVSNRHHVIRSGVGGGPRRMKCYMWNMKTKIKAEINRH